MSETIYQESDVFRCGSLEFSLEKCEDGKITVILCISGVVSIFKHRIQNMVEELEKIAERHDLIQAVSEEFEEYLPDFYLDNEASGRYPQMLTFPGMGQDELFGKIRLNAYIAQLHRYLERL